MEKPVGRVPFCSSSPVSVSHPSPPNVFLPVQLRGGSVLMGLHRGEDSTLSRLEEVLVNDGEWHHLQLDISSLGRPLSHHKAVLSLDQGLYLVGGLDLLAGPVLVVTCLRP